MIGSISFAGRRNLASLNLIVMPDERGCGDVKVETQFDLPSRTSGTTFERRAVTASISVLPSLVQSRWLGNSASTCQLVRSIVS
jgi:hypothetical protein